MYLLILDVPSIVVVGGSNRRKHDPSFKLIFEEDQNIYSFGCKTIGVELEGHIIVSLYFCPRVILITGPQC